jgi:hypothetical protein
VADSLAVHLNRGEPHAVESPADFDTAGPFTVEFTNHGAPTHVHLHADEPLAAATDLDSPNHYVEESAAVDIAVDPDASVTGSLEIVTGYGAESAAVEVTVLDEEPGVVVDDTLSTPRETDPEPTGPDLEMGAVAALAGATVLLAAALTVTAGDAVVVALGVAAVLVALGAAAFLVQS